MRCTLPSYRRPEVSGALKRFVALWDHKIRPMSAMGNFSTATAFLRTSLSSSSCAARDHLPTSNLRQTVNERVAHPRTEFDTMQKPARAKRAHLGSLVLRFVLGRLLVQRCQQQMCGRRRRHRALEYNVLRVQLFAVQILVGIIVWTTRRRSPPRHFRRK
jgi:hypothetical protein